MQSNRPGVFEAPPPGGAELNHLWETGLSLVSSELSALLVQMPKSFITILF